MVCSDIQRLRRITTRAISRKEYLSRQYLRVPGEKFADLEKSGAVFMARHYPEASTGILRRDIENLGSGTAVTTCNFDDARCLISAGPSLGFRVTGVFVSPVSHEELRNDERRYLSELQLRMRQRARGTDDVDIRLAVAARYRRELLAENDKWLILENRRGMQHRALQALARLVA